MCPPAIAGALIGVAGSALIAKHQGDKQERAMQAQQEAAQEQAAEQRRQFEEQMAANNLQFEQEQKAAELMRIERDEQFAATTAASDAEFAQRESQFLAQQEQSNKELAERQAAQDAATKRSLEIEKKRERELAELEAVPMLMRNEAQSTRTKGGSRIENMKVKKKAKGYTSVGGVGGGGLGLNI